MEINFDFKVLVIFNNGEERDRLGFEEGGNIYVENYHELGLSQPEWRKVHHLEKALKEVGLQLKEVEIPEQLIHNYVNEALD